MAMELSEVACNPGIPGFDGQLSSASDDDTTELISVDQCEGPLQQPVKPALSTTAADSAPSALKGHVDQQEKQAKTYYSAKGELLTESAILADASKPDRVQFWSAERAAILEARQKRRDAGCKDEEEMPAFQSVLALHPPGSRLWCDGVRADTRQNPLVEAFALATMTIYLGWLHILGLLFIASFYSRTALIILLGKPACVAWQRINRVVSLIVGFGHIVAYSSHHSA
jgi:hypothetical protein